MKTQPWILAVLTTGILAFAGGAAEAALMIYDGFQAGGASPAANQYMSDPDSTDGTNNDSLNGQGPSGSPGFDPGVNWTRPSLSGVASSVYPRVLDTGLTYTDTMGNTLVTAEGAVDWHRDSSGVYDKQIYRDTNLSTALPETGYFSALMKFNSGIPGTIEMLQGDGTSSPRSLIIGFDNSGTLIAATEGNSPGSATGGTFSADATYLLFAEIVNDGTSDDIRIWVNPEDLSDPMAGTPDLTSSNIGGGWVGSNASYTIDRITLDTTVDGVSQFIWDEIRVGATFEDVLPFTGPAAVPEPSTFALAALGLLGLACFGWRKTAGCAMPRHGLKSDSAS